MASASSVFTGPSYAYSKVDATGTVYSRCVNTIGTDTGWVAGLTAAYSGGGIYSNGGDCSAITSVGGLNGTSRTYGPFGTSNSCIASWPVL